VSGPHLNPGFESGSLDDEGYVVTAFLTDDPTETLTPSTDTPTSYKTGVSYTFVLSATGDSPFRGFLFRLDDAAGSDTTSLVEPDSASATPSQTAAVCTAVGLGGVTHINNDEKTEAAAIITLDSPGTYTLKVTGVEENRATADGGFESHFYFSEYQLDFADETEPPVVDTPADTPAPTATPLVDTPATPAPAPGTPAVPETPAPAPWTPPTPSWGEPSPPTEMAPSPPTEPVPSPPTEPAPSPPTAEPPAEGTTSGVTAVSALGSWLGMAIAAAVAVAATSL